VVDGAICKFVKRFPDSAPDPVDPGFLVFFFFLTEALDQVYAVHNIFIEGCAFLDTKLLHGFKCLEDAVSYNSPFVLVNFGLFNLHCFREIQYSADKVSAFVDAQVFSYRLESLIIMFKDLLINLRNLVGYSRLNSNRKFYLASLNFCSKKVADIKFPVPVNLGHSHVEVKLFAVQRLYLNIDFLVR